MFLCTVDAPVESHTLALSLYSGSIDPLDFGCVSYGIYGQRMRVA